MTVSTAMTPSRRKVGWRMTSEHVGALEQGGQAGPEQRVDPLSQFFTPPPHQGENSVPGQGDHRFSSDNQK